MFDRVIAFSLRNRLLVVGAAALLLVHGLRVAAHLPVDVFPDLNRPTVTIMTEAPGLAPEEVETLVTRPLEAACAGTAGATRVRSFSGVGLSVLHVEFGWSAEVLAARQLVQERLAGAAGALPEGIHPVMGPISSVMGEIMLVALQSDAREGMEVRELADWVVRPRLLAIPGVAQVVAIGGGRKQYQVLASPGKLATFGVSLDELEAAVAQASATSPGGYLEEGDRELLVRNVGRTHRLEELRDAVVDFREGVPVRVGDLARVVLAPQVKRGDGSAGGRPAVILSIQKQPGASTLALTAAIDAALREIGDALPPDVRVNAQLFRQSRFIEAAVANVEEALRDGSLMVAAVLLLFLGNLRTTAITLTAIPLSFATAAAAFGLLGMTVNTMTLGGLAIAIGEVVDDAIVDVENVTRRLREAPPGRGVLGTVLAASREVRGSIVFATAIVVLVFVPLLALPGVEGRLFAPLGIAYVVAILASLAVSLTVTPALCATLLPGSLPRAAGSSSDGALVRALKSADRRLLEAALDRPLLVMFCAGALVALALGALPFLGAELLPDFDEGTATVSLTAEPGTSLSASNRAGTRAEELLLTVPEVVAVGRRTGRAELDEHAEGVHSSEIDVDLAPGGRPRAELLAELRAKLATIPGVRIAIGQPISHRLDHLLSGVRAEIAVKLFGPDLDVLRAKAAEIEAAMAGVAGVVDLQTEKQVRIPQLQVRVRRDAAARHGLKVGELTRTLETALAGRVAGQVLEGQRSFDLVVRLEEESRSDAGAIRRTLVATPSGARLPIEGLADVEEVTGPNLIAREDGARRIVVQGNVAGRDLASVVGDVRAAVSAVGLPEGYFVTYGGQFESQVEATRTIAALSLLSLAAIFLVLHAHFRSTAIVLQILVNVPLALVGAVAAIVLTGGVFSVATLVGFVTLCGIASRNTIMMISHYVHLVRHEGESFGRAMIVRGSLERLVPVTMTALTAGLALVPLALSGGAPGKEILHPVAVVILGGLVSSTLLDAVVTPVVFHRFGERALRRLTAPDDGLAASAAAAVNATPA